LLFYSPLHLNVFYIFNYFTVVYKTAKCTKQLILIKSLQLTGFEVVKDGFSVPDIEDIFWIIDESIHTIPVVFYFFAPSIPLYVQLWSIYYEQFKDFLQF